MSLSAEIHQNRPNASEIKFLLEPQLARAVREWVRLSLDADPFAGGECGDTYRVTSLYFDTPNCDVLNGRGSYGRAKYRIRKYDMSGSVFLERKLKKSRIVTKRRSIVAVDDLPRLEELEADNDWPGYWFHRRLLIRDLAPSCQISYLRTARMTMSERVPMRITMDQYVQATPLNRLAFDHACKGTPLTDGRWIMELKYVRHVPSLFKVLMEEFALCPRPISKYRLAGVALGLTDEPGYAWSVMEDWEAACA
jgi:hypothetical protein